jgi:hypothetical protein
MLRASLSSFMAEISRSQAPLCEFCVLWTVQTSPLGTYLFKPSNRNRAGNLGLVRLVPICSTIYFVRQEQLRNAAHLSFRRMVFVSVPPGSADRLPWLLVLNRDG